jgi:uncharacterized protein (DUF433 family)
MPAARFLTHTDRANRHKKIVAAYVAGATGTEVAEQFGLTFSHVYSVLRLYGVVRKRAA